MRKLFTVVLALLLAGNVNAGRETNQYPDETSSSTRVAYNMLLNGMDIIQTCAGCRPIIRTNQEPAVCWPFPIEWEVFYAAVQANVNEQVLAHPKRDQGKLGGLIGWYVWNAVQDEWGC